MLWYDWLNLVCELRSACARSRTFLWMSLCLAGFSTRKDLLGVTSIVRAQAHPRLVRSGLPVRPRPPSRQQRIASNRYKPWQAFKYYLLFALLVAAFLGSALVGLLDPIALSVRSFALSILPSSNYALPVTAVSSFKQAYFRQGFPIGAIFIVILALNLLITRLWCRALCPLGALLGLASRWSILGLRKHEAHCADCNRCLLHCQGGDDPIPDR